MRPTLMAALLTLVASAGCDGRDIENELNAATAQLQAERETRQKAEQRAAAAEALANELAARGNPISSLQLLITIECVALPGRTPVDIRGAATIVALIRQDGGSWRLIDDGNAPPQIESRGEGGYNVTFVYHPEDDRSILGLDVEELRQVSALGVRYRGILSMIGLEMTAAGIIRLRLELNGLTVIDASGLGLPDRSSNDGFQSLEVSSHFASAPEAYFETLRRRAQNRSSN